MKFLQKFFSNRFYKLLFYILPLFLVSYFIVDIYSFTDNNENIIKQKVDLVKNEKSIKLFDFVKDLEIKIKENNLEVKNMKIGSKTIAVHIEGDFIKSINIIDFVEKYSSHFDIKRASFELISADKIDLSIEVELSKNSNYYNQKIPKIFTSDVLYQKNNGTITKNYNEIKLIRIDAIIDNSVLINNTWYKVGSFINDKEIVLIKNDHIALEKEGNIKKVWMYDNEYTR